MPNYIVEVDSNGTQFWFNNGKLHREDGPAIIFPDGTQFWYINGNPIVTGKQIGRAHV